MRPPLRIGRIFKPGLMVLDQSFTRAAIRDTKRLKLPDNLNKHPVSSYLKPIMLQNRRFYHSHPLIPPAYQQIINKISLILSEKSLDDCKNIPFTTYKTLIEPLFLKARYTEHDFDLILALYQFGHPDIAYKLQASMTAQWSNSTDIKLTIITSLSLILSRGELEWSRNFVNLLIQKFDKDEYRILMRSLMNTTNDHEGPLQRNDIKTLEDTNTEAVENSKSTETSTTPSSTLSFVLPDDPLKFKYTLANSLVRFSLELGYPLLASSLLIQFCADCIYIQTSSIYNCIRGLLIYDPKLNPFLISAIYHIYCAYPDERVILDSDSKRKLVNNGIRYCKGKYPSFANECFNLAVKMQGDPVPITVAYKIILLNLQFNNIIQAANVWNYISKSLGDLDNHDRLTISALLLRLSKDRKYLKLALSIAKSLPTSYYNLEGITEGLIMICARTKDVELTKKIYQHLTQPLRRSTLTELLKLHLVLDDSSGVARLLTEINHRGTTYSPSKGKSGLTELELSSIINALAYHDIARAETFLERFSSWPSKLLLRSYSAIINQSIDKKDWITYDKYIALLTPYDDTLILSTVCSIENIRMKAVCAKVPDSPTITLQSAQHLWQSFSNRKFYQIRERKLGLNIITDFALRLKIQSTTVIQWLVHEYINLGMSWNDINQHLQVRHNFRTLPTSIQKKWLEILKPHDQVSKL